MFNFQFSTFSFQLSTFNFQFSVLSFPKGGDKGVIRGIFSLHRPDVTPSSSPIRFRYPIPAPDFDDKSTKKNRYMQYLLKKTFFFFKMFGNFKKKLYLCTLNCAEHLFNTAT